MIILLSFTTFQWPLQQCIQSYYIDQLFDRLLVDIKYCRAWQIFTYRQRGHSCSPPFYWILWIHIFLPFSFLWDHLCVYFCQMCCSPWLLTLLRISSDQHWRPLPPSTRCVQSSSHDLTRHYFSVTSRSHVSSFCDQTSHSVSCYHSSIYIVIHHRTWFLRFVNQCRSQLILHSEIAHLQAIMKMGGLFLELRMSLSCCLRLNSWWQGQLAEMIFRR